MSLSGKRVLQLLVGTVLLAALAVPLFPSEGAYAVSTIEPRSLTLEPGVSAGGSQASGVVNHLFTFTLPSSSGIQSIGFQYCTTPNIDTGGSCVTPTGLSTTAATLGTVNGDASTFGTLHAGTNGTPYISAASGVSPNGLVSSEVQLLGVTNPDNTNCGGSSNCTFFVRISAYTSNNATGTPVAAGTVAASINTQIVLTGTMPESLIFCTGGSISINGGGVPDCSTATSGSITFNQLFSTTSTSWATSQMAASTNALSGYVITVAGPTLTSGSNTIPAVGSTATGSSVGIGQFGMNLMDDSTDPTLSTPANPNPITYFDAHGGSLYPASNGTNLEGNPSTNFNTGGSSATYAFTASSNNIVAASDYSSPGTGHPTDTQRYTATYIVNVAGHQAAGTYVTTLTYICTPTF